MLDALAVESRGHLIDKLSLVGEDEDFSAARGGAVDDVRGDRRFPGARGQDEHDPPVTGSERGTHASDRLLLVWSEGLSPEAQCRPPGITRILASATARGRVRLRKHGMQN